MTTYFNNIVNDYIAVEITTLFLFDKNKNLYYNLITLIELVPEEQESSSLCGTEKTKFLDRVTVDANYTVFIARSIEIPAQNATNIFEHAQDGFNIKYKDILDAPITIFENSTLVNEPTGEYPLLIDKNKDEIISPILPNRKTAFRVWTKIDRQKKLLSTLDQK